MESFYDDSLENLERITGLQERQPSYESELIATVREYNQCLNQLAEEGATEDEIREFSYSLTEELDAKCPHFQAPVTFNGIITRPIETLNEDGQTEITIDRVPADNLHALSRGFISRYYEGRWSIVYSFSLTQETHSQVVGGGSLVQTIVPQGCAEVDEVTVDYRHSPTEVIDNLENLASELIEEVDHALYNTDSMSETISSLAEIKPHEMYEDGVPQEVLQDTALYIQNNLRIDTSVPYELEVNGSYSRIINGQDVLCRVDSNAHDGGSKRVLGYINGIYFGDSKQVVGNYSITEPGPHFGVILRVVHDEMMGGEVDDRILVLMKDIGYCESLRDLLRS